MTSHGNRGRDLEQFVCQQNDLYAEQGRAIVTKVATPWRVIGMAPNNPAARVVVPGARSTVDFAGLYFARDLKLGVGLAFDVKESGHLASFEISAVKLPDHQVDHLLEIRRLGGIGFFLLYATACNRCWMISPSVVVEQRAAVVRVVQGTPQHRASLKWAELDRLATRVPLVSGRPDYLSTLDTLWNARNAPARPA